MLPSQAVQDALFSCVCTRCTFIENMTVVREQAACLRLKHVIIIPIVPAHAEVCVFHYPCLYHAKWQYTDAHGYMALCLTMCAADMSTDCLPYTNNEIQLYSISLFVLDKLACPTLSPLTLCH